jgi:hypothetical protein
VYHIRFNKPCITTGIKISSQHKRDLYLLCRRIKNPALIDLHKTYCRILTNVIKTAKKLYYDKLILNSKNRAKTLWKIVKTETKKEGNEDGPPLNNNGKTFEEYIDIGNNINTYFSNTNVRPPTMYTLTLDPALNYLYKVFIGPFPCIQLAPVTSKEIKEMIKSLKCKNPHGYDEIPMRVLKISLPFIISPITYVCNKSISTGLFPTCLKYSQKNPIFIKGNKTEMSNYRPISLLTSFSKVFEKVIYNRVHNHIKVNNILAKEQYGFRNNASTEIASCNLIK